MLHEVLFRLWHNYEDSELSKLEELEELLHPGELELLKCIIETASSYHWIVEFNETVQNHCINKSISKSVVLPDNQHGLYIKAFAKGVHDVLGEYRNEILDLEELCLQNPQLPLSFIFSSVAKYQQLFDMLKSVIEMFQKEDVYGCLLMGRLHKYIHFGDDSISEGAEKITRCFNSIFFSHLCNWIIYGDLADIYNEFFICDGNCADENFLYPEQIEESTESSSKIIVDRIKQRIRRPPPVRKFYINWNMVPMFISEDTAESILFMGRIVWIFHNEPKKDTQDHYQTRNKRDIWEGKDVEYYKKVQTLENRTFDQMEFQSVIEECRIKLTKYLWSVMINDGNLKEHLQLIRDYYALGRGELFHQFIPLAENYIHKSSNADHNTYNLNCIFLETARKIYGENDKTYLRFELDISKSETTGNPWSKLQLNFDINWPLHIIFNPKSMELYNKLFSYLLRLTKTHIHLHKLWLNHMSGKQNIDRGVWTLRQHLIFLVNSLQYYLQVDVIEAQFSLLLKAVKNANEFEDIIKVHHEFISNLLAKTFVLTPDQTYIYKNKHHLHQMPAVQFNVPSKIYNVIIQLLELCDSFCLVASTWEAELLPSDLAKLEEFQKCTDSVVESLLFILCRLHEKSNDQHLLQLLYQLDFNRYFTKSKPNFNLTQNR